MVNEFIPAQKGLIEIELDEGHITEIYIDAQYFKTKFEYILLNDIFHDQDNGISADKIKSVLNKLIHCLKDQEIYE